MHHHVLSLTAALALALTCSCIPIDNSVIGLPQVSCEETGVSMIFNTLRPFTGRIFVKGMSDKDECLTSFAQNSATSVVFSLSSAIDCNMRRQRRVGPQRGVEQSMTVVISFHDTFITKVDRAYRCTCFFMEADKVVTSQFEVSMLPTTDLIDTARMPLCTYSVRRGSITGPVVNYASVGEEVYHVWSCDSEMYGMLVHSCFVDDGAGQNQFDLLDSGGCAIDPVILSDLSYNQLQNMAYVEAHVFKFADRVSTYFQCAISLCMKADGACNAITPPQCPRIARRLRRGVEADLIERVVEQRRLLAVDADVDVSAERIVVLDIDDRPSAAAPERQEDARSVYGGGVGELRVAGMTDAQICLSPLIFGLALSSLLLVFVATVAAVSAHVWRQRAPLLKM